MIHLTKALIRRWLDTLLHVNDTPERTAAAFALGCFIGFSPFLGLHTVIALTLAFVFDLNRVAALLGVYSNLPWIIGGAFALAIVAALDALLCAKLAMPPNKPKEDGNRLLFRLGLANMASACFGGITSGINIGPSIVNRTFGAKTSLSVLINAAVVLAVILVLYPVVSYTPRVVLSAAIMVIAVQQKVADGALLAGKLGMKQEAVQQVLGQRPDKEAKEE